MIPMPIAEVVDRLTINLLKLAKRPDDPALLRDCKAQWAEVANQRVDSVDVIELMAANARVWALEWDIRQGKEQELGLEEIGRRALAIREHNAVRCAFKEKIALAADEVPDVKLEHCSARNGSLKHA